MEKIQKYAKFVKEHEKEITSFVDQYFEVKKNEIREKILNDIKSYLDPIPDHYEKCHGKLKKNGKISLDQTVFEFLEEYMGTCFMDNYEKFGNIFEVIISSEIGYNYMKNAIKNYLEVSFNEKITNEDLGNICDECSYFAPIYCNSVTNEYGSSYKHILKALKIGDKKLSELIEADQYTNLYKDIIWICKGHYDHTLYENEFAALEAFYHLAYGNSDIKLTEELANEVFLYPTFDYIVRSCATMKHFSLQFLFHKTTQEILAERDHIMKGKELLDFNKTMFWRLIDFIKFAVLKEHDPDLNKTIHCIDMRDHYGKIMKRRMCKETYNSKQKDEENK